MIDANNSLAQLPEGWIWTSLRGLAALNPKFVNDVPDELEVSFIPMRCVEELTGQVDLSLTKRYSEVKKGYTAFRNGDVIFAKITPCMENGKVGIVNRLKNGIGFGSTEFHVVRLFNGQMPNRLMFFFLVRESFRRNARMHMTGSAGQLRVPKGYLEEVSFPLPPLPEQHCIVAKIEELFTKLDAGEEALKKVKAQLKVYRQAVLKHAFEGKLTEEWREAHKGQMGSASVLLERIKEERRKNTKGKVRELPPLNTSDLTELPEGWVWTRLGNILTFEYGKGLRVDRRDQRGNVPVYGSNGIVGRHSVPLVEKPCLIVGRKGSIGRIQISRVPCWAIDTTYYVIPPEGIGLSFTFFWFCTLKLAALDKSTAIPGLNRDDAYSLSIPLPPFLEQKRIVEEIERCFSVADAIEKDVEQSLKQAERLRQSILKRAFEGKLVLQDPTDEPAEKLLEHIRAERARIEAEKKATGKTRRS